MILAVDFDGTIVTHEFPKIGEPVPYAINSLKLLKERGHKLILWTCRTNHYLEEAVEYCRKRGVEFDTINEHIPEYIGEDSRKVYATFYIDDKALGVPLMKMGNRGVVDWQEIMMAISDIQSGWDEFASGFRRMS